MGLHWGSCEWKQSRIKTRSLRYSTQKMIYLVSFLATEHASSKIWLHGSCYHLLLVVSLSQLLFIYVWTLSVECTFLQTEAPVPDQSDEVVPFDRMLCLTRLQLRQLTEGLCSSQPQKCHKCNSHQEITRHTHTHTHTPVNHHTDTDRHSINTEVAEGGMSQARCIQRIQNTHKTKPWVEREVF